MLRPYGRSKQRPRLCTVVQTSWLWVVVLLFLPFPEAFKLNSVVNASNGHFTVRLRGGGNVVALLTLLFVSFRVFVLSATITKLEQP